MAMPASLRAWGLRHLGEERLTAILENSTVMSACIQFSGRACRVSARFHISGLDNHQKMGSVLRGATLPLGSDMSAYHLKVPHDRTNGVIVDYGGNIGIAAIAAYLLNKEQDRCVRVLSIEPVPESYLMLLWNLHENSIPLIAAAEAKLAPGASSCGVRPLHMAASRDGREVSMLVGYRSMNAVVEGAALTPEQGTALRRYSVRSINLTSLLRRVLAADSAPAGVDILKLDCEGCEVEVFHELQSSPSLAARIGAITGELHGCGRASPPGDRRRCHEMNAYVRGRWDRTQNSLQLM